MNLEWLTKHTPVFVTIAGAIGTLVAATVSPEASADITAWATHGETIVGGIVTSVGLIATAFVHGVNSSSGS